MRNHAGIRTLDGMGKSPLTTINLEMYTSMSNLTHGGDRHA